MNAREWARKIENTAAFWYLRFGDVEFRMAAGEQIKNRSGHSNSPELAAAIRATLDLEPADGLIFGIGGRARRIVGTAAINAAMLHKPHTIVDLEQLYFDVIDGEAFPLLSAPRRRNIILVGPEHFRERWSRVIAPVAAFVPVADRQCFKDHSRVLGETLRFALEHSAALVVASYSVPSVVLGRQVYEGLRDVGVSFFDAGSLWEPFVDGMSRHRRGWYRKIKAGAMDRNRGSSRHA